MGRNHEVTKEQPLLNAEGNINEPGWARKQVWRYNRNAIKAPAFRIKEWDYYLVMGQGFAAAFTVSDDGYIGLQSVSFLQWGDLNRQVTRSQINGFPMGSMKLPKDSSEGITYFKDKDLRIRFDALCGERRIRCVYEDFADGKPLKCDIRLAQPEMDSMVIATPWDKAGHFYYNQKINTMRASGYVIFGDKRFELDPKTDFGTLDWGRGVWTYDNTWYWGSGNADIDGHSFGFNIGYGFGNTKAASENALFYDGKLHKLDDVEFHIPEDSYMKPWKFTSSDGRFEADFTPVMDREANMDFKVIISDQHQVFGRINGKAVLDDGTVIEMKDMMCFAEKVHNKY